MIEKSQAEKLVYERINEPDSNWPDKPEIVILDEATLTKEYGWVFFYQSAKYLSTNDIGDCLAGNAPYIVNKNTGELVSTGTAYPLEQYLEDYETKISTGV